MSDLLARFQAQTRRKADSDLIRRWEWDARYHGDKNIKIQASMEAPDHAPIAWRRSGSVN